MMNRTWRIGLLALLAFAAAAAHAGQERYDYDPVGRLIRFINPAGEGTEYVYDAVGNILAVRQVVVQPPRISGVAPTAVRHNATVPVVVTGTDLLGATVTAAAPGLRITGLRSSAAEVAFDLLPDGTVPLGAQPFTLSSSTGTAGFSLTVKPELPRIVVAPSPAILAPGETAELRVSLTNADEGAHQVSLTVADPAIASLSAATLDFPAGQTEATLNVTALGIGNSYIDLIGGELASVRSGIHVPEGEPPGDRLRLADSVGVLRTPAPVPRPSGPHVAARVGVVREPLPTAKPVGPFVAARLGVVREGGASGQPVGPVIAPDVGVIREN